jgi:RNA polymerase sigma-70 factor, ECF subfamily
MPDYTHWLARCQDGELAAFTELFAACEGRVYRLAVTILEDAQDAEDITQEVFLRVFRNIQSYQGQSAFTTWLTAIVVNACRDQLRRRKLRQAISLEWLRQRSDPQAAELADVAEERWKKKTLWAHVKRMDDAYRLPVILFYHEGLSANEVAETLNLPVETVYSRLNTARKMLRATLPGAAPFGMPEALHTEAVGEKVKA